jgi:hypothetical protein
LIFSLFFPSTHPKRSDSQRPASEGEAGNVVHNIITISFDSHPVPHENRKRKRKKSFLFPLSHINTRKNVSAVAPCAGHIFT